MAGAHHFKSPKSSDIAEATYEPVSQLLTVTFARGKSYRYAGVPLGVWTAFHAATSKGEFFNRNIKKQYSGVAASTGVV
jgi:KTSC domain-containing protein